MVEKIIGNEKRFQAYKDNHEKYCPFCDAEKIFNKMFEETIQFWNK